MESQHARRHSNPLDWLVNIMFIALVAMVIGIAMKTGWLPAPAFLGPAFAPIAEPTKATEPTTAAIRSQPASAPVLPRAVATPIPGLAQNEATATAQYNEAVQEAQHGAIVLPENDPAPVQLIQRTVDRQPAGDNVPVAEPVDPNVAPLNIQATKTCLHGQVWHDDVGCKNPPSEKGSKVRP